MGKDKKNNIPIVKILEYRELPNGICEMDIEYGQDFINLFKEENPKKKATKSNISKYLLKLIEQHLKEDINE